MSFVILFGRATKTGFASKDMKDALTIIGPFETKELAEDYWSKNIDESVWVHELEQTRNE